MRILFLHQFDLDLAGGSGTYLRLLVSALARAGHDVEVVSAHRPDRYGCTTYALPFDVRLTFGPQCRPGERTFDELSIDDLTAMARAGARAVDDHVFAGNGPDLVLANHISLTSDIARRLHEQRGVPYRIISYGTDTQLLMRDRRYVEWLGPATASAERIFAISAFVAAQIRSVVPAVAVEPIGGAVDTSIFRPGESTATADRVAFVGRLVTEKGIWTLLEALDVMGGDVVLDVVGEGPLLNSIRRTAAAKGSRVNLLGYLPPERVRDVLVRSAALVVPSVWEEPLGLVVLEAMACGVPVVATTVGGIPEMIDHGRNGLLVEPDDPAALAAAVRRILDDDDLRRCIREQCLEQTPIRSHADLVRQVLCR